jgi:Concanavalin A-like lectin/glucanases superfamily
MRSPFVLAVLAASLVLPSACFNSSDGAGPGGPAPDGDASAADASLDDASVPDATSNDASVPDTSSQVDAGALLDASPSDANALDVNIPPDGGAGVGGIALHFDGTQDRVELSLADTDGGVSETSFSVEAWFKTTNDTGVIFEVYSANGGADRTLYLDAGTVCFYVYAPSYSYTCTTAATYADGAWHHAAGTLGADGQALYVDGVVAMTVPATTSSAFTFESAVHLGIGRVGANGTNAFFAGDLDEVRIWSVERTAAEIAANRSVSVDPSTAGLQVYWKLDGSGSDAIAVDSTPGKHDGTIGFATTQSLWVSPGAPGTF